MRTPTAIFIVTATTAGLVFAGSWLNTHRLAHHEAELRTRCEIDKDNAKRNAERASTERHGTNQSDNGTTQHLQELDTAIANARAAGDTNSAQRLSDYAAGMAAATGAVGHTQETVVPPWDLPDNASRVIEEVDWDDESCDGKILVRVPDSQEGNNHLVGIHAEIAKAHSAAKAAEAQTWPGVAALVLLCIGAAPGAWYFLLRRIAELRSAISGKPPL
jgi:hypothetical protein